MLNKFLAKRAESNPHLVYGVAFTIIIIVILLALLLVRSEAGDVTTQQAQAPNVAPVVDTVVTTTSSGGGDSGAAGSSGHILAENTTTNIFVRGQYTDNNGCTDADTPANWIITVRRDDHTLSSDACDPADNNDCYNANEAANLLAATGGLAGTCTHPSPSDLSADYELTQPIQYYAEATVGGPFDGGHWISRVIAVDEFTAASAAVEDQFEIASTTALETVTTAVNYGTVAFGGDSPEQVMKVQNTGNRAIDWNINADKDVDCPSPSVDIPSTNVHYGNTGFTYGNAASDHTTSGIPITPTIVSIGASTDSAASQAAASLASRVVDGAVSDADFARSQEALILRMVASGIRSGATCQNTLTFAAKLDT